MKPVIGINVDIELDKTNKITIDLKYPMEIIAAGGTPILLPPMPAEDLPKISSMVDGVMLIGGDDYDPAFYGEKPSADTTVGVTQRQAFDINLAQFVLEKTDLPVLGICAGCQLINIALGGTLVQDIPTFKPDSCVGHGNVDGKFGRHDLLLAPESKLLAVYKSAQLSAPCWHHQAVKRLGRGLEAMAFAEDGIIEGVQLRGSRFVVGVQWHPEQDMEGHIALFQQFISEARKTSGIAQSMPASAPTNATGRSNSVLNHFDRAVSPGGHRF